MSEYQWLTTEPNPRSRATGFDAGQRGWRLHAVKATAETELKAIRFEPAACGLIAAHGWGLDLYIDKPCARCARKVGGWREVVKGVWRRDNEPSLHQILTAR